jgi:hypothetical protein
LQLRTLLAILIRTFHSFYSLYIFIFPIFRKVMDMRLPAVARFDLLLFVCLASFTGLSAQNFSCSIQPAPTNPASQAYRDKDYSKAAQLYAAAV